MNSRIIWVLTFVHFLILFVLFSYFMIILNLFVNHGLSRNESSYFRNTYRYIATIPLRNKSRFGIVTMPEILLEGEYIIYTSEKSESQIIISKLGDKTYECQGSCFCQNKDDLFKGRRFPSLSVLSRGLFIILSAFSVSGALKIAQDVFRETCVQHFSSDCGEEEIFSEVSSCHSVGEEQQDSGLSHGEVEDEMNPEDSPGFVGYSVNDYLLTAADYQLFKSENDVPMDYKCRGKCSKAENKIAKTDEAIKFFDTLGPLGCGEFEVSGEIFLTFPSEIVFNADSPDESLKEVKEEFVKKYQMSEFCGGRSEGKFCIGTSEGVSCRRVKKDEKEDEELYSKGIEHFTNEMTKIWVNRNLRNDQTERFQISFRELYKIEGELGRYSSEQIHEICEQSSELDRVLDEFKQDYINLEILNVAFQHRSRGLFGRILKGLEEWGKEQGDVAGIFVSGIRNKELERFLGKRGYRVIERIDYGASSLHSTFNEAVFKRISLCEKKK